MKSKEEVKQYFTDVMARKQNEDFRASNDLLQTFAFMEASIKRDLQSFNLLSLAICGAGRRNFKVASQFENAFTACMPYEKVQLMDIAVQQLLQQKQMTSIKIFEEEWAVDQIAVKLLKGIKVKQSCKIVLKQCILDCKHFQVDLSNYLLRRSKKEQTVYIFEAMAKEETTSIRFEVLNYSNVKQTELNKLKALTFKKFVSKINENDQGVRQIKLSKKKQGETNKTLVPNVGEDNSQTGQRIGVEDEGKLNVDMKSLIEELVGNQSDNNINQELFDYLERREEADKQCQRYSQSKYHKNQLNVLLPSGYALHDICAFHDYLVEAKFPEKKMYIYYSKRKDSFKVELTLHCPQEQLLHHLCQGLHQKLWNKSINESQVKWGITSENACILYRKQKSQSDWFKERDFLFIRYLFKKDNSHYIIDRSIENPHFIPFQSIQRGHIQHAIYRIDKTSEGSKMVLDIKLDYAGLLTVTQKKHLALTYLKEYKHFQEFIHSFSGVIHTHFNYDWEIEDSPFPSSNQSFASIASEVFQDAVEDLYIGQDIEDQESFYSIIDQMETPQVTPNEYELKKTKQGQEKIKRETVDTDAPEDIALNEEGHSILPKEYLHVHHVETPIEVKERRKIIDYDNIMLKKDFISDQTGAMVLSNKPKIQAQNNVIKFIMSTLKKNLFSGKGILNISLPVEIFNVDSNLQRLSQAMSMAPEFLERKALKADSLERFKHCISFAMSNSILYFDIDKPFNPILGETFQGLIDGSPVYAEQISHHPPISSILLMGKGYRVYANIEAKVYVHLNSGEGVNEGLYTIEFDDGEKVFFQTAPGEVSGLAMGDRKYRIKGKMIVIAPKSRLCSVITFEDESGMFSSKKWKYSDQMQGLICRVSSGYIRTFFQSDRSREVVNPAKKQIEQTLGKITGRWTQQLCIDDEVYYDINTVPYQMVHYRYPLNSNSNYREDLLYRKQDNMARSQAEKQRLEIVQRNDRKLRQKYHGKAH